MELGVGSVILLLSVTYLFTKRDQIRFLFKYGVFWMLIQLRKRQARSKSADVAGYGVKSYVDDKGMENVQTLDQAHPLAVDAVYFNGGNAHKDYAVFAVARRQGGIKQCILILRVNGVGILMHPMHPDTNFCEETEASFHGGGLRITMKEPMKQWEIQYEGPLRLQPFDGTEAKSVKVKFSFLWNSQYRVFDFDTDQSNSFLCEAIASQPWSRELFDNLKKLHQTHYEQFGEMKGTVEVEGVAKREMTIQGVRDHSYGNQRDWHDLRRYALQYIHREDGLCIAIGCICMPSHLATLKIGFVCQPDGSLSPLKWSNFVLRNLGDNGYPPKYFEAICSAQNGENYHIAVTELDRCHVHMGFDKECRVYERFCTFQVNGKPAWGISEWNYLRSAFDL